MIDNEYLESKAWPFVEAKELLNLTLEGSVG